MTTSLFKKTYLHPTCSITDIVLLFLVLLPGAPLMAAENKKNVYEDEEIYLRFIYRSAGQVAAFYEGREFPKAAIARCSILLCDAYS